MKTWNGMVMNQLDSLYVFVSFFGPDREQRK